jgi:hypothetical protein
MPRTLVRAHRDEDRNRSLGWLALAWMEHFVQHGPGDVQGQPVAHGEEYSGFIVDCYMVGDHPSNNHLLYDSAFLSRPKGCDKSGLGARLALFEALGPARFAGFAKGGEVFRDPWGLGFTYVYEPGEPMGRPVTAPMIRCLATEETQAASNVFATIHFNLTDEEYEPPLSFVPGVDAGVDKILLPGGGDIRVSTASSSAKDGGKETFCVLDETHLYTTPELKRMYRTITRNMRKRKKGSGTWFYESTTMFDPSEDSMAKATYEEAEALREGRKKRGRHRLMYDHRWGECKDTADEDALRAALIEAYGDAVEWIDIDGLIDEFYDLRNTEADSRRYFLNARTSSSDAWIQEHEWEGCRRPGTGLKRRDMVTLGLDGSVRDDATALVACRVSDGHLELLGLWEKPEGAGGTEWEVDRSAVDAAVANAMRHFEVVGFYADPAHWRDELDRWHREYAEKMKVKASAKKPIEWWTNRPTAMVAALQRFYEAVRAGRVGFTPPEDRGDGTNEQRMALGLTRHVLNARRAVGRAGVQIRKEHPHSPRKIDAAMAAVLAYEAASEAVAQGVKPRAQEMYLPKRIR